MKRVGLRVGEGCLASRCPEGRCREFEDLGPARTDVHKVLELKGLG